jgi:hypothetical protein
VLGLGPAADTDGRGRVGVRVGVGWLMEGDRLRGAGLWLLVLGALLALIAM